jgi:hypothetical protein
MLKQAVHQTKDSLPSANDPHVDSSLLIDPTYSPLLLAAVRR